MQPFKVLFDWQNKIISIRKYNQRMKMGSLGNMLRFRELVDPRGSTLFYNRVQTPNDWIGRTPGQ
jgi:hypothetical protein